MEKQGETVQPPAIIEREELAKSRKAFKRSIQDEDMPLFTLSESVSSTSVKEETVNSDAEMIPSGDKERVISELKNEKNKGSHQHEIRNRLVVKPDASKEVLAMASIMNRYLRYMHKNRYPQTDKKRREFNKRFYKDLGVQVKQKKKVIDAVRHFINHNIKKSVIPRSMVGNPELEKLFNEVVANYPKRGVILKSSTKKETASKKETRRLPRNIGFDDDETSDAHVNLIDSDVHMENIQEGGGENELGGRPEEMKKEIMQLKMKIAELSKSLESKNEEKRFLDEWARSLEETLKKKEMEEEAAKMTKKEIPDDVAKWEEEKHHLEDRTNILEGKLRSAEETNEDLKKKNQSLEEALHKKDQMLETFLNMHSTIQSLTKSAFSSPHVEVY